MKMIKQLWMVIVPTLMVACDFNGGTNPSLVENKYFTNAVLSDEYPFVMSGDSIVFDRFYRAEDEENIADDEYSEDFFFQIPGGITEFSYEDEELETLKVTLKPYCFCGLPTGNIIEGGSISGEKKGDNWEITADVNLKYIYQYDGDSTFVGNETINKSFTATFMKKSIPTGN